MRTNARNAKSAESTLDTCHEEIANFLREKLAKKEMNEIDKAYRKYSDLINRAINLNTLHGLDENE